MQIQNSDSQIVAGQAPGNQPVFFDPFPNKKHNGCQKARPNIIVDKNRAASILDILVLGLSGKRKVWDSPDPPRMQSWQNES